jgi:hypothetical protein
VLTWRKLATAEAIGAAAGMATTLEGTLALPRTFGVGDRPLRAGEGSGLRAEGSAARIVAMPPTCSPSTPSETKSPKPEPTSIARQRLEGDTVLSTTASGGRILPSGDACPKIESSLTCIRERNRRIRPDGDAPAPAIAPAAIKVRPRLAARGADAQLQARGFRIQQCVARAVRLDARNLAVGPRRRPVLQVTGPLEFDRQQLLPAHSCFDQSSDGRLAGGIQIADRVEAHDTL